MHSPSASDGVLRVAAYLPTTKANGPGVRASVWVQGCSRACPGCINEGFQPTHGGRVVAPRQMGDAIAELGGLDGVTVSGGEPFEQAEAVADLLTPLRDKGLVILVYSGFTLEEISASKNLGVAHLLTLVDILIDGPFMERLADGGRWRGSSNQRVLGLTSAGVRQLENASDDVGVTEVDVTDGNVRATGDVGNEDFERIRDMMSEIYGVTL